MCAVFKQNVKKFYAIAHTKNFALTQLRLLIKTGNIQKERRMTQTTIRNF